MFVTREGLNTEFKREYIEDIRLAVIAFANTDGGELYVGVEDDGTVCGVSNPDEVILRIQNSIRDSVTPDIMMFVNTSFVEFEDKTVVKVEVHRGTKRPYFLRGKGLRPEGVFVRQGPSTVPASFDAIRQMIVETSAGKFEQGVSFDQNLTFESVSEFFKDRNIAFGSSQMQTLGLINQDRLFTNLALLLSDQCQHTLKVAVFQGTHKTIFRDRAEFSGSMLKQLEDAYAFIMRYNSVRSTFKGLRRIDSFAFPEVAVREGLLNAVVHRDYGSSGPILVNIFDDRLEILNQGGLLPNMTVEEVRQGVSEQRNKLLAAICYRLELIEAYGTGYDKIDVAYANSGKIAQIKVTQNSFLLSLPNLNYQNPVIDDSENTTVENDSSTNFGGAVQQQRMKLIIDKCKEQGSVTRKDVERLLDVSVTTANTLLKLMQREQILRVIGRGKSTRYQLN